MEKMTDKLEEDYRQFQSDVRNFHNNNERTGLPREYQVMAR